MATDEEYFTEAVDEALKYEKKALKYKEYTGEVDVRRDIDLYPADYVDVDYTDMLNLYDRANKIITAQQRYARQPPGVPVKGVPAPPPEKEAPPEITEKEAKDIEEVETRLKGITREALKKAEEIAAVSREAEKKPEEVAEMERIEFEREMAAEPEKLEIEFEEKPPERKPAEKLEIEKPEVEFPEEKAVVVEKPPIERPPAEEKIVPEEKPPEPKPEVTMPRILESADEAADKKYNQIEEEIMSALGKEADEASIKKRMLELTKQLFKEKSVSARERIKLEITVLKNMLVSRKKGLTRKVEAKAKKKKGGEEEVAHAQLLETIVSTQKTEVAQTKDSIISSYKSKVDEFRKKFYEDVGITDDPNKKKKLYDSFVFALTKISEELPAVVDKYRVYTKKKHLTEMENITRRVGSKEKDVLKQIEEQVDVIEKNYDSEFNVVRDILSKEIDGIIRTASREVFEAKEEEKKTVTEKEEEKADQLLREINELDEGTLLYYLHSKDAEYYKKYERKHLSKAEAISRSKVLMAKEKGLNDELIRKYFGNSEG